MISNTYATKITGIDSLYKFFITSIYKIKKASEVSKALNFITERFLKTSLNVPIF